MSIPFTSNLRNSQLLLPKLSYMIISVKVINRILIREIKPYTWQLIWVALLMLLSVGFEIITPWPFKFLIDNVLGNEIYDKQNLITIFLSRFNSREAIAGIIIFVFFLSSVMSSLVDYLRSLQMKQVMNKLIRGFSKTAFENLEAMAIGFYRKQEVGDYIYRLSYDVSAIGDFLEEGILPILTSALYLIATTVILFTINIKLTLLSLAALPFLTLGLSIINKKIVVVSKKSERWNSMVFSFVEQALSQLKIIQAFSQEKRELYQFDRKIDTSLEYEFKTFKLNFLLSLVVGLVIAISYSMIIAYGTRAVFNGEITVGLLIVFIFYLDNLTSPVLSIIYGMAVLKESHIKISRMNEFFNDTTHISDTGTLTEVTNYNIKFENVSLDSDEGYSILDHVNLTIPEGKITVIVGPSGSGKTSLISLIPRLINEPTSGCILIGERSIHEYTLNTLRKIVAYVPQETLLFNQSIREIIAFGKPDCSFEEIKEAARLAITDKFIESHKSKYNFRIGEEGNYLSGGQRQRLMLARAYVKNAPIMILDEVFASQDIHTRAKMLKNLLSFAKNKTLIITSNILEVINIADQVVVINDGKVIKAEKPGHLLHHKEFSRLFLGS